MVDVAVKRLSLRSGWVHKAKHRWADHVERRTCRVRSSAASGRAVESSIWTFGPQRVGAPHLPSACRCAACMLAPVRPLGYSRLYSVLVVPRTDNGRVNVRVAAAWPGAVAWGSMCIGIAYLTPLYADGAVRRRTSTSTHISSVRPIGPYDDMYIDEYSTIWA